MEAGYDARDFLLFALCVLMIQEKQIGSPIDDDPPFAVLRMDVKLAILEMVCDVILMAELVDCLLFFAEPDAHYRAAVTHAIACLPCFFQRDKASFVFLANTSSIYAVGIVKYFLAAFRAVKYHGRQLLPYLLTP